MLRRETIIAGLKKLGPCSPATLADHLEVEASRLGYHLNKMLAANELKAAGISSSRRFALPDQQLDASSPTPPQQRRKKARKPKAGRKAKQHRKARRAAPRAQAAERFIPTVDVESRLVIVNGAEPLIFSDEQTSAIAALLFQHYNKD